MNKILIFLIGAFIYVNGYAQIAHDLVIFSPEGLKFTLFMNGEQMNEKPLANVKVENTEHDYCMAKIVFEDEAIPSIETKNLVIGEIGNSVSAPMSAVYRIKQKKGAYKLGFVSRSPKKIQRSTIIIDD